eukprot:GHVN01006713.1.p1 GENE.GHVN01006713.1~~GHVN01006713.1.p1  ORF type:complete len:416 (+),score=61.59 GHVN01006713.1:494-1741(+)
MQGSSDDESEREARSSGSDEDKNDSVEIGESGVGEQDCGTSEPDDDLELALALSASMHTPQVAPPTDTTSIKLSDDADRSQPGVSLQLTAVGKGTKPPRDDGTWPRGAHKLGSSHSNGQTAAQPVDCDRQGPIESLSADARPTKRRRTRCDTRNVESCDDNDMELALALSLSMANTSQSENGSCGGSASGEGKSSSAQQIDENLPATHMPTSHASQIDDRIRKQSPTSNAVDGEEPRITLSDEEAWEEKGCGKVVKFDLRPPFHPSISGLRGKRFLKKDQTQALYEARDELWRALSDGGGDSCYSRKISVANVGKEIGRCKIPASNDDVRAMVEWFTKGPEDVMKQKTEQGCAKIEKRRPKSFRNHTLIIQRHDPKNMESQESECLSEVGVIDWDMFCGIFDAAKMRVEKNGRVW